MMQHKARGMCRAEERFISSEKFDKLWSVDGTIPGLLVLWLKQVIHPWRHQSFVRARACSGHPRKLAKRLPEARG